MNEIIKIKGVGPVLAKAFTKKGFGNIEKIADDGDVLFVNIKKISFKKIILKRPIKADIIDKNINYQVKGKSTRFDIYI